MNIPEISRCVGGGHHSARFGGGLHTRGDIRRVAENVGVLACARANHNRSGIDADARRQRRVLRGLFVELGDSLENREASTRRALGVIVMGLGITEESHHAVAQIFRDMAAVPNDRFRRRAMVRGNGGAPVLGIHASRDRVEPTRSQNNTVRCRRSPAILLPGAVISLEARTAGASGAPHWAQNLASGGLPKPQFWQGRPNGFPH